MAKNKIVKIGKDYESAFLSICRLVKGGAFDDQSTIVSVDDDFSRIVAANSYEFVLDNVNSADGETKNEITKEGATWFTSIRNMEEINCDSIAWMSLVENVAREFHKNHSFLEFRQVLEPLDERNDKIFKSTIDTFMELFYKKISYQTVLSNSEKYAQDIYGLSLVLDIDSGLGESQKIICKIYFSKKSDNKYYPINKIKAEKVENSIYSILSDNDGHVGDVSSNEVMTILSQLDSVITKSQFGDYVVYEDEKDKAIVSNFLKNGPQGTVDLYCRKVKVQGIYHAKWNDYLYSVQCTNASSSSGALDFLFDQSGNFTVYCANCRDEEPLVNDSVINFIDKDKNEHYFKLSPSLNSFGLSSNDIDTIKKLSPLSTHLKEKSCPTRKCKQLYCLKTALKLDKEYFCSNCPHPEVVFMDENNVPHLTRNMAFARDKMTLVDKSLVSKCKCCGRTFTTDSLKNGLCSLCSALETTKNNDENNVYKKYKICFPIFFRALTEKKDVQVALEDSDIIVFKIGKSHFVFDKLNIGETGYIKGPRKVNVKEDK